MEGKKIRLIGSQWIKFKSLRVKVVVKKEEKNDTDQEVIGSKKKTW